MDAPHLRYFVQIVDEGLVGVRLAPADVGQDGLPIGGEKATRQAKGRS
jgi:hypothetical protein